MSSRFGVILVNLSLKMGLWHHLWMGFYCLSRKSHQQFTPAANLCSCKCMWIWWIIHTGAELLMVSDCFEVSGRAWLLLDFLPPPVICPLYNSHFFGTILKDLIGLAIVPQGKNAMNQCPRVTLFGCAWSFVYSQEAMVACKVVISILSYWRRLNVFGFFRSAECPNAVLRNEGPENHPADPASSFVLGYLATMLREPVPLF